MREDSKKDELVNSMNNYDITGKNEVNANRNYKDTFFRYLFNQPENFIQLYKAIHPEDDEISIQDFENISLEQVFYCGRYNDVAYNINNSLIMLVEHQSTLCFNMPLRMFLYIASTYEIVIGDQELHKKNMLKLPYVEFYVVLKGKNNLRNIGVMKLSDAFINMNNMEPQLELIVPVITDDENDPIYARCSILQSYFKLVSKIEKYKATMELEKAIKQAMKEAKEEKLFKQEDLSREVELLLSHEWTAEDELNLRKQEAREEGLQEGLQQGLEKGLEKGLEQGLQQGLEEGLQKARNELILSLNENGMDKEFIAKVVKCSIEEIEEIINRK